MGSGYSSLVQYCTSQLALRTVHWMRSWECMVLDALGHLGGPADPVEDVLQGAHFALAHVLGELLLVDEGNHPVARRLDVELVRLGVEGAGQAVPEGGHHAEDGLSRDLCTARFHTLSLMSNKTNKTTHKPAAAPWRSRCL